MSSPCFAMLAVLACAACAAAPGGGAAGMPADFTVRYHWSNGSLPPPYHYSYTAHLGPGGGGRIEFRPGYDAETWTEEFPVTEAQLRALHAALRERGVFDREWPQGPPMVGGRVEWLEATVDGRTVKLPAMPRDEDRRALQEVYAAVTSLVPADVMAGLVERRERRGTP